MKKTITERERLELLGLLTLGRSAAKRVNEVEEAMCVILEAEDGIDIGHFTDAVWDEATIDSIIKNSELAVE